MEFTKTVLKSKSSTAKVPIIEIGRRYVQQGHKSALMDKRNKDNKKINKSTKLVL